MTYSLHLAGQPVLDLGQTPSLSAVRGVLKSSGFTPKSLPGPLDRGRTPAQMTALTDMERDWLGQGVRLADGREGQVWALSPTRSYVWVALTNQQAVSVHTEDLTRCGVGTLPQPLI